VWAVIDTSVYIGHWERGLYADRLDEVRKAFVVRHSAVVLSELRRGARTPQAARTVARLHELASTMGAHGGRLVGGGAHHPGGG
jgi:hypothetical protein